VTRTIKVKLDADTSGFISGLARAGMATKDFTSQMDKAAKAGKLDHVADQAMKFGIAGVAAFGLVVKAAADFDKQMSAVSAATHASSGELGQLRAAAMQAGKDTQFSATEAAKGITELSKAGVSTAAILSGGLKGALSLAAAGQIDVGQAAETAASAMTQFKLKGDQIPHVADLLAAGAGKAQGSVQDLSAALNQSGLIASQTGLSIEDTTGTLAAFASAGLLGSDAGTSFKTMLQALQAPSAKTKNLMDELGISAYDARGNFVGITALAGQLKSQLGKLTPELRANALAQIFGSDATRAASVLYQQGAKGIQTWIDKTNDAGYAATTAAKLTDNLAGDLERLKGSLETVAISSGTGAASGLRTLTQAANGLVNAFLGMPAGMQSAAVEIAGVSGGLLLTAAGFIKARKAGREFVDEIRSIGPAGAGVVDGLGKIGSVAGKLGLAGIAVTGVFLGFKAFGDWVERKHAPVRADIDLLTTSVKEFAATGQVTGELASKYGSNLDKIGQAVSGVTKGMADLKQAQADVAAGLTAAEATANWNPVDPQAVQQIADLDKALTQLVSSGGATQARVFLQELASSGRLTAAQFEQLTGMLPSYTQAVHGAATANSGLAHGFGTASANAKTLTGSLDEATTAGQTLTDVWTQLNGAVLGSNKADLAAKQAIDAVTQSFKANGTSINESGMRYDKHGKAVKLSEDQLRANSEAALKNRIAVGSAAEAAVKAAQAKFEETGSVKAANKTYDTYIGQLRKTMLQSGLAKGRVDQLLGSYAKMPKDVTTKVSITGDKAVANRLDHLWHLQQQLKAGKINIPANVSIGHAEGGWTGPGSKWQPAGTVHADEFVVRKDARQPLEAAKPGALDYMNTTGRWPGYEAGGQVWPFPVTAAHTKIPSMTDVMSVIGAFAGRAPSGVLAAWIAQAIALTGVPSAWAGPLNVLIQRESGGNPRAINLTDSNAKAGHPSQGLMQTIPSTFAHYRLQSLPNDITNPVANIVAGIRYIESRYGSIYNVQQANPNRPPKGYANGGTITEPIFGVGASGQTYTFGESGRHETVVPGTFARGGGTSGGGGGTTTINVSINVAPTADRAAIGQEVASVLNAYSAKGGRVQLRGTVRA
jgi:TP901 family phage tail tape measure protein